MKPPYAALGVGSGFCYDCALHSRNIIGTNMCVGNTLGVRGCPPGIRGIYTTSLRVLPGMINRLASESIRCLNLRFQRRAVKKELKRWVN